MCIGHHILVGAKCDLPRKVKFKTVMNFVRKNKLQYVEFSTKNGTHNNLFACIAKFLEVHGKYKREN